MAVTKRTRFEVFRRDGFRCYYCGTPGKETGEGLTIDHVTPVALGGSDDPSNLVSACRDCNYGKSSVPADADTVASVDRKAAEYARARKLALEALEADLDAESDYAGEVWEAWDRIAPSYAQAPRDMFGLITSWHARGVPIRVITKAFRIAWDGPAASSQKARYAAGVVNNLMAEAEDRMQRLVAGDEVVYNKGYQDGMNDGQIFYETYKLPADLVAEHIDRGLLHA